MNDFIRDIFAQAKKIKASDIHIHSDQRPAIRVDGRLYVMEDHPVITHRELETFLESYHLS